MDRELLQALTDIGSSLEALVEALDNRNSEPKSDVSKTLVSGEFSDTLTSIVKSIKEVKSDTKKILQNQETILASAKSKEEASLFGGSESGNNMDKIKDGVSTIVVIAAGVLAIGLAFNLIGTVDVLSVIALGVSMLVIAKAFKEMATIKELNPSSALTISMCLGIMSLGIVASSYALSMIQTVSIPKMLTAILISGGFALMGSSMKSIVDATKDLKTDDALKFILFGPVLLGAFSLGIVAASYAFNWIKPIGAPQLLTAIAVAGVFAVIGFSLNKIVSSFKGMDPADILNAVWGMPLLFTALSLSIALSSYALGQVQPISLPQFLTALGVSILFIALSFSASVIAKSVAKVEYGDILKFGLINIALMGSIYVSAHIINQIPEVNSQAMINTILLAGTLGLVSIALYLPIRLLGAMNPKDLILGGLAMIGISGVIMVASHILGLGNYDKYPSLDWALGSSASMLGFGLGTVALGAVMMTGFGALALLAGIPAMMAVASTIVAVSNILKDGKYDVSGMASWATSTALLYMAFTPAIMALAVMSVGGKIMEFFGADNPFDTARKYMEDIAHTIVNVSSIFATGKFVGGPSKEWAQGVGIAIGAFAPVYRMLINSAILGSSVSPESFNKAIKTVGEGIVESAKFFNENSVAFSGGPSKEWAEGVGGAIGAFAPVYDALAGKSWFKSGAKVIGELVNGVRSITHSIILSAKTFASVDSKVWESYPGEAWGKGINSAISAYTDVFIKMEEKDLDISDMLRNGRALNRVVAQMVSTSRILHNGSEYFNSSMDAKYMDDLSNNVMKFVALSQKVEEKSSFGMFGGSAINRISKDMISLSRSYNALAKAFDRFGTSIDKVNIEKLREIVNTRNAEFDNEIKDAEQSDGGFSGIGSAVSNLIGLNTKDAKPTETVNDKILAKLDEAVSFLSMINHSTKSLDEYIMISSNGKAKDETQIE